MKVTFPLKMRGKVDIFLFPILHWAWPIVHCFFSSWPKNQFIWPMRAQLRIIYFPVLSKNAVWDGCRTEGYKNDRRNSGGTLRQKDTKREKRENKREKGEIKREKERKRERREKKKRKQEREERKRERKEKEKRKKREKREKQRKN